MHGMIVVAGKQDVAVGIDADSPVEARECRRASRSYAAIAGRIDFAGAGHAATSNQCHDSGIRIDHVHDALDVVTHKHVAECVHRESTLRAVTQDAVQREASVAESVSRNDAGGKIWALRASGRCHGRTPGKSTHAVGKRNRSLRGKTLAGKKAHDRQDGDGAAAHSDDLQKIPRNLADRKGESDYRKGQVV